MGTPSTGSGVSDAVMPGRCAAPPAPAMITLSPRASRRLGVLVEALGRAVRGDDPRLVGDLQLVEDLGRFLERRPVRLASHDDADDGFPGAHFGGVRPKRKRGITGEGRPLTRGLSGADCRATDALASARRERSGDDVGEELILDRGDAILEGELRFFRRLTRSWSAVAEPSSKMISSSSSRCSALSLTSSSRSSLSSTRFIAAGPVKRPLSYTPREHANYRPVARRMASEQRSAGAQNSAGESRPVSGASVSAAKSAVFRQIALKSCLGGAYKGCRALDNRRRDLAP